MICIKCGQEFEEGKKFCEKCGFFANGNAPGKMLLKISGILFIVFGVFGIIGLLSSIATRNLSSELGVQPISGIAILLGVFNTLFGLFLGITGVMYCNNIKKAKILRYFAFGYIGFYVISSIHNVITTVASLNTVTVPGASIIAIWSMIFGILIGFVIPILYLIGAQKNSKI